MTEAEKKKITALRQEGLGYKKIVSMLAELIKLAGKSDYTEKDIETRTDEIINSFVAFMKTEGLIV